MRRTSNQYTFRRDFLFSHVLFAKCDDGTWRKEELWSNDIKQFIKKYGQYDEVVMTASIDKQCVQEMWTVINEIPSQARQVIYHYLYGAIKSFTPPLLKSGNFHQKLTSQTHIVVVVDYKWIYTQALHASSEN